MFRLIIEYYYQFSSLRRYCRCMGFIWGKDKVASLELRVWNHLMSLPKETYIALEFFSFFGMIGSSCIERNESFGVVCCRDRKTREKGSWVVRYRLSLGGWKIRLGVQAEENGLRSTKFIHRLWLTVGLCISCALNRRACILLFTAYVRNFTR